MPVRGSVKLRAMPVRQSHTGDGESWHPADWEEDSPWMKLFCNARAWVG